MQPTAGNQHKKIHFCFRDSTRERLYLHRHLIICDWGVKRFSIFAKSESGRGRLRVGVERGGGGGGGSGLRLL